MVENINDLIKKLVKIIKNVPQGKIFQRVTNFIRDLNKDVNAFSILVKENDNLKQLLIGIINETVKENNNSKKISYATEAIIKCSIMNKLIKSENDLEQILDTFNQMLQTNTGNKDEIIAAINGMFNGITASKTNAFNINDLINLGSKIVNDNQKIKFNIYYELAQASMKFGDKMQDIEKLLKKTKYIKEFLQVFKGIKDNELPILEKKEAKQLIELGIRVIEAFKQKKESAEDIYSSLVGAVIKTKDGMKYILNLINADNKNNSIKMIQEIKYVVHAIENSKKIDKNTFNIESFIEKLITPIIKMIDGLKLEDNIEIERQNIKHYKDKIFKNIANSLLNKQLDFSTINEYQYINKLLKIVENNTTATETIQNSVTNQQILYYTLGHNAMLSETKSNKSLAISRFANIKNNQQFTQDGQQNNIKKLQLFSNNTQQQNYLDNTVNDEQYNTVNNFCPYLYSTTNSSADKKQQTLQQQNDANNSEFFNVFGQLEDILSNIQQQEQQQFLQNKQQFVQKIQTNDNYAEVSIHNPGINQQIDTNNIGINNANVVVTETVLQKTNIVGNDQYNAVTYQGLLTTNYFTNKQTVPQQAQQEEQQVQPQNEVDNANVADIERNDADTEENANAVAAGARYHSQKNRTNNHTK